MTKPHLALVTPTTEIRTVARHSTPRRPTNAALPTRETPGTARARKAHRGGQAQSLVTPTTEIRTVARHSTPRRPPRPPRCAHEVAALGVGHIQPQHQSRHQIGHDAGSFHHAGECGADSGEPRPETKMKGDCGLSRGCLHSSRISGADHGMAPFLTLRRRYESPDAAGLSRQYRCHRPRVPGGQVISVCRRGVDSEAVDCPPQRRIIAVEANADAVDPFHCQIVAEIVRQVAQQATASVSMIIMATATMVDGVFS